MNRKAKILFFILLSHPIHPSSSVISISKRCESIHRQKYLTLRLKRVISLLRRIPSAPTRNFLQLDPGNFRHPELIDTITKIQKQQSLSPLFDSWESLAGFRRVDDPLFAREFTELIFTIQRQLVQRSTEVDSKKAPSMSGIDALLPLEETSYTEAMATRYYYTKRIEHAIHMLRHIQCTRDIFFERDGSDQLVPTRFHTFEHPEVIQCITQMHDQNSLTPLIWLSDSFKKMKCLNDELFLKEFLLLQLAVQHNIGVHSADERNSLKEETLQEVTAIYRADFNRIPIEQILDGINNLSQGLPPLIEKLEVNNPDLTWKEIWQKHKWSIVGNVAMGGVNLAMWLLRQKQAHGK